MLPSRRNPDKRFTPGFRGPDAGRASRWSFREALLGWAPRQLRTGAAVADRYGSTYVPHLMATQARVPPLFTGSQVL